MSQEIRALSIAEVLDHSFHLLRDNFLMLWGIAAIVYVPLTLLTSVPPPALEPGTMPPTSFFVRIGASALLALTALPLAQLAITHAVSETYLGREVTIGSAYRSGRALFVRYIGTILLLGIGVIVGFMLFVFPGLYLVVIWMLVGPVLVTERVAGSSALGRSRALMRDNWWRGVAVLLVSSVLFGVASGGLQLLFQFIPYLGPVLTGMVSALAYAFYSAVLVVFYFELRCRQEDFDLQILSEQIAE